MIYGCESWIIKKVSTKELMHSNCGAGETLDRPLDCKEIKPVSPTGNQPWTVIGSTDAEAPILWLPDVKSQLIRKDPVAGKDWGRRRGDNRGWDGWMTSPTQWTWVWANSGRWWRTGKPGVLQSIGSQRIRHNWVTEEQQARLDEEMCGFGHGQTSCC